MACTSIKHCTSRGAGKNHIYMVHIYGFFGREITKYMMYIYVVLANPTYKSSSWGEKTAHYSSGNLTVQNFHLKTNRCSTLR